MLASAVEVILEASQLAQLVKMLAGTVNLVPGT